jgi:hypothetical protein
MIRFAVPQRVAGETAKRIGDTFFMVWTTGLYAPAADQAYQDHDDGDDQQDVDETTHGV